MKVFLIIMCMEFHFIPINLDLGFYVSTAYFSIRFLRTDFKIKESTFSISANRWDGIIHHGLYESVFPLRYMFRNFNIEVDWLYYQFVLGDEFQLSAYLCHAIRAGISNQYIFGKKVYFLISPHINIIVIYKPYCNDTDFGISAGAEIFIGARTREKGTAIRLLITQYCSCILFWLCNL